MNETPLSPRMSELARAAVGGAGPEEILATPVPDVYLAAHVHRDDIEAVSRVERKDAGKTLRLGLIPMPEIDRDEVLVAIMASAINYNTVWTAMFEPVPTFRFLEQLGRQGPSGRRHDLPHHVVGSDGSGIIVRAGDSVRHWSVGDKVVIAPAWIDEQDPMAQSDGMLTSDQRAWGFETNFGGLAHFAVVKATQLLAKPEHLSWEEAACNILCAATAYRMLVSPRGAQLKQGDTVLIWGAAGGLGGYAVQLALNGGATPVAVVGSEDKAKPLIRLGCEAIIDRSTLGCDEDGRVIPRELGRAIRKLIGEDPHIVFEHVGRATFATSVFVARRGGTIVTCGSSTGYTHEFDNRYLWMKLKRIIGSHGANYQEAWETNRLISQGKIQPILSRTFALEDVSDAARLVQQNAHTGKVGILCLAPSKGLGIDNVELRAKVGEARIGAFRQVV